MTTNVARNYCMREFLVRSDSRQVKRPVEVITHLNVTKRVTKFDFNFI